MIRTHVLICGGTGCTSSNSLKIQEAMNAELIARGLENEVKVVLTGCFGLCALGPVMIVYPEGTFYSCVKPEDVPEIVEEHFLKGRPVERLVYHEAKDEDIHHATSPKVREYMDYEKEFVTQNGYVETIYGRRRYLGAELESTNFQIREFAQRAAINQPLQGTAADLVKMAMIEVDKRLSSAGLKTKMVLQVHDELIFEVPKSELEEVKAIVLEAMELGQPLKVQLEVDVNYGVSWKEN